MEIRVLESAKVDLREGYRFYENQNPGLGDYFLDSIQADVKSLRIYAGIHVTADGFFRVLANRFPFGIYYLIAKNRIDIYAVLDCRRDPSWISGRLKSSRKS